MVVSCIGGTRAPGTPPTEVPRSGDGARYLEVGLETPLFHSEGSRLWLVGVYVTQSVGTIQIVYNEPRGPIVRIRLPAATEPIGEPAYSH